MTQVHDIAPAVALQSISHEDLIAHFRHWVISPLIENCPRGAAASRACELSLSQVEIKAWLRIYSQNGTIESLRPARLRSTMLEDARRLSSTWCVNEDQLRSLMNPNLSPRVRETTEGLEKYCPKCSDWWPADLEFFFAEPKGVLGLFYCCKACYLDMDNRPGRGPKVLPHYTGEVTRGLSILIGGTL